MTALRDRPAERRESSQRTCSGVNKTEMGCTFSTEGLRSLAVLAKVARPRHPTMNPDLQQETLEALLRIAEALEALTERQGTIANSLLQLSDLHGSSTFGPY